jgi:hypothetical protein
MWGKRRDWGTPRNYNLDHVFGRYERFEADPVDYTSFSSERFFLLGHAIPAFQRNPDFDPEKPIIEPFNVNASGAEDTRRVIQPTWDEMRMIAFLETAVEGGHLGTWTFHAGDDVTERRPDGTEYFPRDLWLIDGQQRFWSLHCFFQDKFPVFGRFWSEVDEPMRRKFLQTTPFQAYEMRNQTELQLRQAYDKMNFGGVSHTAEQRATPGLRG